MVFIELVEDTAAEAVYDYMPERPDAERGRIAVDKATGDWRLLSASPASEWSEYYFKAAKRAIQLVSSGDHRKTAYAAFY